MIYEDIAAAIGRLVDKKKRAYGDSFYQSSAIIKILYPNGIAPEQYHDMLVMIRIIDKFFRIATDKNALSEDPWADIAGYAIFKNEYYLKDIGDG